MRNPRPPRGRARGMPPPPRTPFPCCGPSRHRRGSPRPPPRSFRALRLEAVCEHVGVPFPDVPPHGPPRHFGERLPRRAERPAAPVEGEAPAALAHALPQAVPVRYVAEPFEAHTRNPHAVRHEPRPDEHLVVPARGPVQG